LLDWKKHSISSYNFEFQAFIGAAMNGSAAGTPSCDRIAASDACVATHSSPETIVLVRLPEHPALHA
jgi:hypothetical protein